MGLDIRLPIGLMFTVFGLLLTGYGLATNGDAMYARHSLGYNANLYAGLGMLAFGAVMLLLSRRGAAAMRPAERSSEGRRTEELERQSGSESGPRAH